MDNRGDTGEKKKYQHTFFSTFRFLLGVGMIFGIVISAPVLVGRFAGHAWGFLFALINMVVYVWFGARLLRLSAFSTRVIWVIGIFLLICIAGFEFTQMSR